MHQIEAVSLYTASTELCADSIEAVPGVRGLFALATYQVDKEEILASTSKAQDNADEIRNSSDSSESRNRNEQEGTKESAGSSPAYTRRGTCTLHRAAPTKHEASTSDDKLHCETLQTLHTPAILDMKWSVSAFRNSAGATALRTILGIANARSEIELQKLSETRNRLDHLRTLTMNDSGGKTLCLSLDWSDRSGGMMHGYDFRFRSELATRHDTSLVVSQSDGSLCYLPSLEAALSDNTSASAGGTSELDKGLGTTAIEEQEGEDHWEQSSADQREESLAAAHAALNQPFANRPRGLETWNAHDYEAWIVGFDCWLSSCVLWSGGDDLSLRGWDLRTPISALGRKSTFSTSKCFDGGVTTLQSSHLRQHLWAVGSYDSKLRLFDARNPRRPLSQTDMGGGIWRVKWHPTDPAKLLVGCMHDGFKIVSHDILSDPNIEPAAGRGSDFEIVKRFDGHASLAYGCDWDRHTENELEIEDRLVFSCSFYDTALHIWRS